MSLGNLPGLCPNICQVVCLVSLWFPKLKECPNEECVNWKQCEIGTCGVSPELTPACTLAPRGNGGPVSIPSIPGVSLSLTPLSLLSSLSPSLFPSPSLSLAVLRADPFPASFQSFLREEALDFFCSQCHKQISRLEDLSTRLNFLEMNR